PHLYIPGITPSLSDLVERCLICAETNATKITGPPGVRYRGTNPGEHCELDFTEIKKGSYGYKYLSVLIDTFSSWVEVFPMKGEETEVTVKKLLQEIIPRFDLPLFLGSDNGPAFMAKISKLISKTLGIEWKLHCAY
ncbi:NYNRI protein, partial [Crocuta crocuta]